MLVCLLKETGSAVVTTEQYLRFCRPLKFSSFHQSWELQHRPPLAVVCTTREGQEYSFFNRRSKELAMVRGEHFRNRPFNDSAKRGRWRSSPLRRTKAQARYVGLCIGWGGGQVASTNLTFHSPTNSHHHFTVRDWPFGAPRTGRKVFPADAAEEITRSARAGALDFNGEMHAVP